jgi:hypothetical protein
MSILYVGNTLMGFNYLGDKLMDAILPDPTLTIDYIVSAGGGGAGDVVGDILYGGGGGAGGCITGSAIIIKTNTSYTTIVGAAGIGGVETGLSGFNGGNSSLIGGSISVSVSGGGGGGSSNVAGKNGGTGGGGGVNALGGTGISGQGFGGGSGSAVYGGCGGGMTSAGTNFTTGSGITWFDGLLYGFGGSSDGGGIAIGVGGGGNYDWASQQGKGGNPGRITIRYAGTPQATGGSITQSGGFTYHTFTSVATSSFTY